MTFPVPMDFGLIDYRAAIAPGARPRFRGAFLCEHYGNDAITVIGRNRAYVRELLARSSTDLDRCLPKERHDVRRHASTSPRLPDSRTAVVTGAGGRPGSAG